MHARVPQDVDLEDRLFLGLTAVRFGELALACLAALAVWKSVPVIGGGLAAFLVAVGAAFAWVRWRGRAADHWVPAAALYLWRAYRLEADADAIARWRRLLRREPPAAASLRVLDGTWR